MTPFRTAIFTPTYDVLGRLTSDAVATLGSGVDGAVNTGSTPSVQYAYSLTAGGANHSRLTSITYPNGKVLSYNYNTGVDSTISRLSSLSDNSGTLESLSYLGLGTVVKRAHPQPNVDLTYVTAGGSGDGGDQYTGLDRFGRVVEQKWYNNGTATATDDFKYGYDRNSNVLWRTNEINHNFDELYHANGSGNGYDNLNQLVNFERGTLNSSHDTISSPSHSINYSLDAQGNFSSTTTDGGSPVSNTFNKQNEETAAGSSTLTFDANGNLTTDDQGHTLVYDAWNRLVAVKSGGTTLVSYKYDALGRRIVENPGTVNDLYYDAAWQILEERLNSVSTATAEFDNTTDSIAYLNLTGGTLTGSADVMVTARTGTAVTWNGGATMSGSGSTTLASGAIMSLGGDPLPETLDGRSFNNKGTVNWLAGSVHLNLIDGALFNNESGAGFNAETGDNSFVEGAFTNAGTFLVSGPSAVQMGAPFNNTGTVNNTGILILAGGTNTGSFVLSSSLYFESGINNFNAPTSSVTGSGLVDIEGGEVDFGGTYNITGQTAISGGTVNFLAGGSSGAFTNSGGVVNLTAGTALFAGTYTQSSGSTYLNGGTLGGVGCDEVHIEQNSSLYGPGTVNTRALVNDGAIYVGGGGNSVGTLNLIFPAAMQIPEGFNQTSTGVLYMNIGGATAGTQYDQLNFSFPEGQNGGSLGGTLNVTLLNGYNPPAGTQFDILTYPANYVSGDFATKNLPSGWTASPGSTDYVATS